MNDNKINEDNLRKLIYLRERELGINSELQLVESNLVMAIEKIISIAPSFAEGVDLTTASIMDNLNMILYNLDRAISVENNSEIKTNLNTQRGILADKIDEYAAFKKRVDDRKEIIEKARNLPKGTITAKISNLNNKKEELARTKNKLKGLISQGDMESLKGTIDYLKGKVERLTSEIEAEKDILEIYKSESSLGEALRKNKEAAMAFIEKYSNDLNQNIDNDIELFNNEIMEFAKEHDIPLLSMGIIEGKFREVEDKKDMLAILDNKKLTAGDIKALISLGMGNEKALAITKQLEKHKENALAIGYLKQKLLGTGNNPEIVEKITELEKKQQLFENRLSLELALGSQNLTLPNGRVVLSTIPRNLKDVDYILNGLHFVDSKALVSKENKEDKTDKISPINPSKSLEEQEEIKKVDGKIIDDEESIKFLNEYNKRVSDVLDKLAKNFPEVFDVHNLNLYMDNPTVYDRLMAMYENLQKQINDKDIYKDIRANLEKIIKEYDIHVKNLQDYKERIEKELIKLQNDLAEAMINKNDNEIKKLQELINSLNEKIQKIDEALKNVSRRFENRDEEKKKSSDNHLDVEFREIDPKEDQKDSDKDQEKESQKDDVKNASPEGNETKPGNDETPEKEGPKQIGEGKPDNPEGHDDGDDETIPGDETPEEGKNGPEKDTTPPLLPPHVIKLTDEQKEAYEEIVRQGIGKFSNTEFTDNEVADFVNNHPLISKFAGPDEAQIKENIKNDILKYCKKYEPEIPEDDEEEKKDWKALLGSVAIFTGGFATGLALSCVPGVGTIRMAMATAKLGVSAVNFVSEKLGHGKIINISQKIEQLKNSKFAKKHPKIAAGVDKAYEVLTSKEFNLFVNGVSAGYITGNVIEMVTGKTVLENIKSAVKPNETPGPDAFSGADGDNGALAENTNGTTPDPKPPVTPTETPEIPIDLTPVQGQTYDLSEIAKGYVASGNKDAVNLITSAGKDAVFDRAVTAGDGQIWYHFKQANGLGYAWFPKDVVEEVIEKSISR